MVADVVILAVLVLCLLVVSASSAKAAYLHTTVTGEYGKEGPKATGTGSGCRIGYQSEAHRLYLFSDGKIYGLDRTGPGTVSPLPGFPFNAINSSCGDPDFEVDNSSGGSKNNLYAVQSNASMFGWNSSGTTLTGWPVSNGSGETCGVALTGSGEVWGGHYTSQSVKKFTAAGTSNGSINIGYSFCKLEVDRSNNDLYVAPYSGAGIKKYTSANGYSSPVLTFPSSNTSNPGMAVDGTQNRLYVGNNTSTVKSYDTESGALIESINIGASGGRGIAVDEPTDTLFVQVGSGASGVIKELSGAIVPDITTGDPISNTGVSGHVDPAGGGEVTECYFEYGTTTAYGSTAGCTPATFTTPQDVTATLSGLLGETTYHYRLVAGNVNGKNYGSDKTITPHNVRGLKTEDAESITRTGATLKGSFEGNGEETKYYFEWGTTTAYGSQSAIPPGVSAGSPTYPPLTSLSYSVSNLQPDTLYHYRVIAENGSGISPGQDKTVRTLPAVQDLTTTPATNVAPRSATLNGSYTGDGTPTTYYFEWGMSTAYGTSTPTQSAGEPAGPTPLTATLSGLELETTYHYRVVATNSLGTTKAGPDRQFTTNPAVAGVVTNPATGITQESVTLNGEFTGNGEPTQYYFEYGPTTAYGAQVPLPEPGEDGGSPVGPTPVSAGISDYLGYTTYHYRLVASNSFGVTRGPDVTFETLPAPLPEIVGTTATEVAPTGAMLQTEINPNRWTTVYRFQYGKDASYGKFTPAVLVDDDNTLHTVATSVTGLAPGTTYHYRALAINFTGTTHGPDQRFVTPGPPRIESSSASSIGPASAHLGALAAGNGMPTNLSFEYGTSESYGQSTAPVPIGAELVASTTEVAISGLAPGTTYHFRAVATNAVGTTVGADQVFTTQPSVVEDGAPPPLRCKRGFVKRRGRCVRHRRRHRHPHRQAKREAGRGDRSAGRNG